MKCVNSIATIQTARETKFKIIKVFLLDFIERIRAGICVAAETMKKPRHTKPTNCQSSQWLVTFSRNVRVHSMQKMPEAR